MSPASAVAPAGTVRHGWTGEPAIRVALHLPATPDALRHPADDGPEEARPASSTTAVVVCPPLGQDHVVAYRTLRLLSEELSARGVASVRFDPSGTGDSAPDDSPDAPVTSALTAAALLRDAGWARVVFVGLTSGALIAAEAARRLPGAGLVVWDAPASGRAWVRRQRALATMSMGADRTVGDRESLVGIDLAPGLADRLAAMTIGSDGDGPVLAVTRPGAPVPPGLAPGAVHVDPPGTAELLDGTSMAARIPGGVVEVVADWARDAFVGAAGAPSGPDGLDVPAASASTEPPGASDVDRLTAPVHLDDHLLVRHPDGDVVDRVTTLGPDRLFAVESVPAGAGPRLPVVVLHNGASEHRVGAADYQVDLARQLARDGVRVVRFDRRGTGESGPVSADELDLMFSQEWIDDQAAVVKAVRAGAAGAGDDLAVVGMCSGAWLAARSAPEAPRLVIEISPNDYRRKPAAPGAYVDAAREVEDVSAARHWARDRFNRWAPPWLRLKLARRGPAGDVGAHLGPVVQAGSRSVLVMSPLDAEVFDQLGGADAVEQLGGGVEVVRVPEGDHSLFAPRMRATVAEIVRARVAEAFGTAGPGGAVR